MDGLQSREDTERHQGERGIPGQVLRRLGRTVARDSLFSAGVRPRAGEAVPPSSCRSTAARWLSAALAVLSLASCAGYPNRVAGALSSFQAGEFHTAAERFGDESLTGSAFLSGAEAGSAALAAGDWEAAIAFWTRAAEAARDLEERALLGAKALGEGLVSFAISESLKDYVGEGYERVQVHAGLALAYLATGRLDDVYVEARLSNELLEAEEELYESDYGAGGLGHFVSALTYELLGRPSDAYIDYKRMHAKGLAPALIGPSLVRLARRLGRDDELPTWESAYGEPAPLDPDFATITVVAGVDLAPFKAATTLPIPTSDGLLQWSVPQYVSRGAPAGPASRVGRQIELGLPDDGLAVRGVVIEDVDRVARENLEDRIAWLAAKSAVRAFAKRELTRQLEDQHGFTGRLIGDLFTILTERADLRSWQTLPAEWQAARAHVPAGTHTLHLATLGGDSVLLGQFELEPGEAMFVLARTLGPRVYAHVVGGRLVDPAATPLEDAPGVTP